MIRRFRSSVLAAALAILAPLACGVTAGNSGSNTNWLRICTDDGDCSDGYRCLCGVCTSGCELEGDGCSQAAAECTALSKVGCAPSDEHDSACLPNCSDDSDCESFGDGLACETGVCVASTALDDRTDPTENLELPPLEPLSGAAGLALGGDSPCVTREGRVWCWGSNGAGQAAQPPGEQNMPIAEIEGLEGVAQVVAGGQHKCALTDAGNVYCWGLNDQGQVGPTSAPEMTCSVLVLDKGPADVPCQPTPTQVPGIANATALAVNDSTSCAVDDFGTFTCWGAEEFSIGIPEGSTGVRNLALGNEVICMVLRDTDELGCNDDTPDFAHDAVRGLDLSLENDGGPDYGCVIDVNGRVDCWGRDDSGQRGLGSFGSPLPKPDDPPAITEGAQQVRVGQDHACALLEDGTVTCWGRNDYSQTGTPPNVAPRCAGMPCQPSPAPVAGIPPAAALAIRGSTTCALSEDAELYCWGGIDSGSPWKIPGPWEGGKNSCDGIDQAIAGEILEARRRDQAYAACQTERDCVEVDLGVSCYQGCQSATLHKDHADALAVELGRIEDTYCPSAEHLDCDFARPDCPPRAGELACVEGACVRFDADATECDNACACKVLQNLALEPPIVEQQCEGHHLMLHRFVNCGGCDSSRLYFAVANYGQAAFAGDAVIELASETGADLPESMIVELSLEPGEHSEPLYFEFSEASGPAHARLVVADNCDYMGEWSEVPFDVPAPATCSE